MTLLADGLRLGIKAFGVALGFSALVIAVYLAIRLIDALRQAVTGDSEPDDRDENDDETEVEEVNRAFLIGHLANDPELTTTANGVSRCAFRIAVQRRFANQNGEREADFIPVICWRQTAENVHRYLIKGNQCAVTGSLQTRSYDAQDGEKRYVTEVIADEVQFLTPRPER